MGMFGLRNHSIQDEMVYHESIPQILWDDLIPHVSTKQKSEMVMDQLIPLDKPNKK
jgi:hypothetical protein